MEDKFKFAIAITVIIIYLIISFGYYVALEESKTQKIVTVNEKWVESWSNSSHYMFSDKEDNVYTIEDIWVFNVFNSSDRYAQLRNGKTYDVTVYGWRVQMLSWYPNVTKFVEREK